MDIGENIEKAKEHILANRQIYLLLAGFFAVAEILLYNVFIEFDLLSLFGVTDADIVNLEAIQTSDPEQIPVNNQLSYLFIVFFSKALIFPAKTACLFFVAHNLINAQNLSFSRIMNYVSKNYFRISVIGAWILVNCLLFLIIAIAYEYGIEYFIPADENNNAEGDFGYSLLYNIAIIAAVIYYIRYSFWHYAAQSVPGAGPESIRVLSAVMSYGKRLKIFGLFLMQIVIIFVFSLFLQLLFMIAPSILDNLYLFINILSSWFAEIVSLFIYMILLFSFSSAGKFNNSQVK